jgi:ribosomal protein S24E
MEDKPVDLKEPIKNPVLKRHAVIMTLAFAMKKPTEKNIQTLMAYLEDNYRGKQLAPSDLLGIRDWCKKNCD